MSILFLVRHAQASFLAENYDKLSELGQAQAQLLGKYWVLRRFHFDRVCVGSCVRQIDTVKLVSEAYTAAGGGFPGAVVWPGLAKYKGGFYLSAPSLNCFKIARESASCMTRSELHPILLASGPAFRG